ncbi:MAG: hypothetical protein WD278_15690, partial [Pirellulales bacterium]
MYEAYQARIEVNTAISRALVSYQSNRRRPYYRWFKYKEGFSAALVEYLLGRFSLEPATMLDPFAGSGAALFASRDLGWQATGIELLPVGVFAMQARLAAARVTQHALRSAVEQMQARLPGCDADPALAFAHLPITRGAFSDETGRDLTRYRTYLRDRIADPDIRLLLDAACLTVLESVSYTRKDGQYLRWDERAPRELPGGRTFNKGRIQPFSEAVRGQLNDMLEDMSEMELLSPSRSAQPDLSVQQGSCLHLLPAMPGQSYDLVITSPPYCNRYDYTRTYALELAYLGIDTAALKALRQGLLSCTVENRGKVDELRSQYAALRNLALFERAMLAFERQQALKEVLAVLDEKGRSGQLNNANVPRMVKNYFIESAVVVFELGRVVRPGGRVIMVNDNVQYAGEEVPVDLILCDLAA